MHHANNINANNLHFVGDGSEVISCHSTASEAIAEARRLNDENETTEYASYAADISETDNEGNLVFSAEALAAREAGF